MTDNTPHEGLLNELPLEIQEEILTQLLTLANSKEFKNYLSVGGWVTQKAMKFSAQIWSGLDKTISLKSAADLYHLFLMGRECDLQLTLRGVKQPFGANLFASWIFEEKINGTWVLSNTPHPDANWFLSSGELGLFFDQLTLVPLHFKEFVYYIMKFKQVNDNEPEFRVALQYGRSIIRDSSRDFKSKSLEKMRELAARVDVLLVENVLPLLEDNGQEYDQAAQLLGRDLDENEMKVIDDLLFRFERICYKIERLDICSAIIIMMNMEF
jgi:hypothetical protein